MTNLENTWNDARLRRLVSALEVSRVDKRVSLEVAMSCVEYSVRTGNITPISEA
jgi:hypothetical protein